ncbi:MAG TPA: permease [Humidesulfovibrio sp.]|uniref:permease n=1 Tax=Humidesulfovibrio sp. TaxID=2910988 RepID=UPI002D06E2C3|nr:permease [Humidesulfovibrio sp.]HWR02756.1 permease [Humidesulfovibrio sp.]
MDQSAFAIFAAIVTSIVLEAAPFLLLGSLLSSVIAVYVGDDALARLGQKSLPAQIGLGLFAGLLLPTCECGVVPVTRRLIKKGVPAGAAIPFMLAAPVVNPVSLAATWVAFQGDLSMVAGRVALVVLPAAALGWALGSINGPDLLRPTLDMAHDAHAEGCGCGCGHDHAGERKHPGLAQGLLDVLRGTGREFLDMGLFLIVGACAAGLFKVFLPQEWLTLVSANLWLAVPAMMLLAVLMSICSEADAFVAASLSMFPRPALLAFLALGPMLDLKLIPALASVFQRRVALVLILAPAVGVYMLAMSLGLAGVFK